MSTTIRAAWPNRAHFNRGDILTLVEQYEGYALYKNERGEKGYLFPDDIETDSESPPPPPDAVATADARKHPDCKTCQDPAQRGGPSHDPSRNCESGKRPHCSCDTCF